MLSSTLRTIDLGDGSVTTLEQWGASGPALLCAHGIGSSRKSWLRTAEAFAASYRVFAWGGTIVLKGGPAVPCSRVIAIDPLIRQPAGRWASDFVDDLRAVLALPATAREPAIREMFAGLPPVEIDAKVHAMRYMSIEPILALGADNAADAGRWDLRDAVRAYPKPLLLLLADPADSVVSADDTAYARAQGGPNVTIETFAGEGHTLHRTAFERFAAAVTAFLHPT